VQSILARLATEERSGRPSHASHDGRRETLGNRLEGRGKVRVARLSLRGGELPRHLAPPPGLKCREAEARGGLHSENFITQFIMRIFACIAALSSRQRVSRPRGPGRWAR
jgi:hypothetical protein